MNTTGLRTIECFCRSDMGLCAPKMFRAHTNSSLSGTYTQPQQDSSNSQTEGLSLRCC